MVPLRLRLVFGFAIAAFVIGAPLAYRAHFNRTFRAFRVVKDGVLYRSAQVTLPGFQRLWHDYRFKSVICIRQGDAAADLAEERFCGENGIRFVRIAPRNWGPKSIDGIVPAEDGLKRFFEVIDDPKNHPVLVHCFAGTHRTGAYVAVYRMEREGWSNEQALRELRTLGYVTLDGDEDVFEFLSTYKAHCPPISAVPVSRTK